MSRTKWRTLLAVLICVPNQVVSADRLIEELWGSEPPPSARKLLQGYVSQLRRYLGDGYWDGTELETCKWGYQAQGYQLNLHRDAVDAERFERLLEQGRSEFASRHLSPALSFLEQALALWRGSPFTDVPPTPTVESEATRLEELRLQALECQIEIRLHSGTEAMPLTQLPALVAAYPLRERFSGQLMWAFYRAGRRADALKTYGKLRRTLIDELGVEPSTETQQLHQQILSADAALLANWADGDKTAIAAKTPTDMPRQLPTAAGGLIGRTDALSILEQRIGWAEDGPAVVAIDGIAGVGKSALAIEAAHRIGERFPGGHLYIDLHGSTLGMRPLTPARALQRLLRAVMPTEPAPTALEEAAAQFRSRVADQRMLLVLDNAGDADQVRPLLPGGRGCAALVTSRRMLTTLDSATHVSLDVLPRDEAAALFDHIVGHARIAAAPQAAMMIVRMCCGLPLAVRIAGARLAARPGWSLHAFAERLADPRARLDLLKVDDLALRASFEVSYRALADSLDPLDKVSADLFRLLGMLDEPSVGVPLVAALLDEIPSVAEAALERLVDVRLAEDAGPGRCRLRELLWLFAMQKTGNDHPVKLSDLTDNPGVLDTVRARLGIVHARSGTPASRF